MNPTKTELLVSKREDAAGAGARVDFSNVSFEDLQKEMERRKQLQTIMPTQSIQILSPQLINRPIIMPQSSGAQPYQQPQQVKLLMMPKTPEPYVVIVEQPKSRGLRFRYKCEGRSAGSIPGEGSTNERKTYPTIQIVNFNGPAAIVVASCVTKDKPYQPHPHNLVGQDCKDGVCTIKVKGNNTVSFPNIGIQCCKRHDVDDSLKMREKIRVDPFGTGYNNNIQNIDLNTVRLCFQVFLPDANKKFTKIVTPIVSQQIIDKKSIHDLVICRLSKQSGYANGGDEVFLLCEKINKDDIQVRFYQETDDGISWEAFGEFAAHDVHRQFAIVFRTPPYKDLHIQTPITVFIQLRRPSDDEVGDPKPFQYIPQERDPYGLEYKRKRKEVDVSSYSDRIPMTVLQEVKDEPENANQDVRSKLKKKAERGLQRKDRGTHDMEEISNGGMADYSTYMDTSDVTGSEVIIPTALGNYNSVTSPSTSSTFLSSHQIYFNPSGSTTIMSDGVPQSGIIYSVAPGPDGQTIISGGSDAENQILMQYLKDNPSALTLMSGESITFSGLSEFNSSGVAAPTEPAGNDLNVGAQESMSDGEKYANQVTKESEESGVPTTVAEDKEK